MGFLLADSPVARRSDMQKYRIKLTLMIMKVFNLCCDQEHGFEGWFASQDDYEHQLEDGMIQCPLCGSDSIRRTPSAPRLNLGAVSKPAESGRPAVEESRQMMAQPTSVQMQKLWAQMAKLVQANTEDVGDRFAEEARRIHYNEAPERGIRGVATAEEAAELADEGIEVMAFPVPEGFDGPVQ